MGVRRHPLDTSKVQQATSVGTSNSNLHTDSQPSYTTDSASAAGCCAPDPPQASLRQEATSPSKAVQALVDDNVPVEQANTPAVSAGHASDKSSNIPAKAMGQSTKGEAAAESQPLPSTSAGSSPPVQTTTRKRPRPSAQQPKSLPPKHTSSDIPADGAASTEGEGVQSGSRRRATLQTPQCNSEDQSQQSFHAMGLIEQVGLPEMIRLADQHSVVWCRVKGFPAWPAQIMTAAAAKLRLGQDPKSARLPIMFFGTTEITWSSSKDVYSWGQGIKDDLWSKNKQRNRQLFDLGVEQVRDFLHPHAVRKAPQHWWCKPPVQLVKQAFRPASPALKPVKAAHKPASKATPKATPQAAAKTAVKAVPKAATAPPKFKAPALVASRPQTPITQCGRVTKLPSRLAANATADVPSDDDDDRDESEAMAIDATIAKAKSSEARKSAVNPRPSKKALQAGNQTQASLASQSADMNPSAAVTQPQAGADPAEQPTRHKADPGQAPQLPHASPGKQRKASTSRHVSTQAVGSGSGFLAKALGQLMDQGHLLEALQELLAALPRAEPLETTLNTAPLPAGDVIHSPLPSTLAPINTAQLGSTSPAEAMTTSSDAAEAKIGAAPLPAAKVEEQQGHADVLPATQPASASNALQPTGVSSAASQQAATGSATGDAPAGAKAVLPRRLKGGAAVLAKVFGLDMLAIAKQHLQAGQLGQDFKAAYSPPLQTALASLGLSEQQLSRVAERLIAELQHRPQPQAVTLQGLSSEAQQGLQDIKEALQAASVHCHASAVAAATQQHPQPAAVLAAQPAALTNVPEQLAASKFKEARDKAPQYSHIDRNVYGKPPQLPARPKRQPKDDIPVCNCHLPRADGLFGSLPARQPTQRQASSSLRKQMLQKAAQAQTLLPTGAATESVRITQDTADMASPHTAQSVEPLSTMPNGVIPAPTGSVSDPRGADFPMGVAVSTERMGCSEECLNRLSFIHCDPKLCPCGEQCSNRPFHQLQSPKVEVFLTPDRGWGVKAAEPIAKGSFIVEYAGEVISDVACEQRMQIAKQTGEPHFYMMELAPGLIIDARKKGNVARLINSSCAPNCESQKWHDAANGEVKVGIFALRDIPVGEELSYDYQFQHYGLAQAAGDYRCMCGAPTCRGTMDSQPERRKDFGKRIEVWWEGDNVYYRGTIFEYSKNTDKHTVYYDDGEREKVSLSTTPHRWLDEGASQHSSPRYPTPDSQGRCLPPRLPSPQGKPSAKSKAAGKLAPKKQAHSRKRKLDDTNLQAAAMQLQAQDTPAQPMPQLVVAPSTAAAPVPFSKRPLVHSDSLCIPVADLAASSTAPASSHSAQASVMQLPMLVPQADIDVAGSAQRAGLVTATLPESTSSAKQLPETLAQPGITMPTAAPPNAQVAEAQTALSQPIGQEPPLACDREKLGSYADLEQKAFLPEGNGSPAIEAVSEGLVSHSGAAQSGAQPSIEMRQCAKRPVSGGQECSAQMALTTSQLPWEGPQQTAQNPQLTQQLPSAAPAPLFNAVEEASGSAPQPASAAECMTPAAPQWPHGSDRAPAAALDAHTGPTQDGIALNVGAPEAHTELNASQAGRQLLSHNVPRQANALSKPSVMPEALLESGEQQPIEQSVVLSLSLPGVYPTVAAAVEAADGDTLDVISPVRTEEQGVCRAASVIMPQESGATVAQAGQLADKGVQPFCLSSGSQICDVDQVQNNPECYSNSASRSSRNEGTVTLLTGDGLLGLSNYQGSESDSDS